MPAVPPGTRPALRGMAGTTEHCGGAAPALSQMAALLPGLLPKHGFEPMDRPSLSEPNKPALQVFFHTCQAPMMPL